MNEIKELLEETGECWARTLVHLDTRNPCA